MENPNRVRKTDEEKKEKKRGSRKKYEQSQHIVRMGKNAFDRWQAAKTKECVKTNNEMVMYLLDLWFIHSGEETRKHGETNNKNSNTDADESKTSGSGLKRSPYVGCTLRGLPIMQAFRAHFTEHVSERCGIFLIVPYVPAPGSDVADMTLLTATRDSMVDSSGCLQELISDTAVIKDEHMDATLDKNQTRKHKPDIIIKKELDDSVSDTLMVEDITDAIRMTIEAPDMNNQRKKRKQIMSQADEDPNFELSDEKPYIGLSDKEFDFELSDENPDFGLSDKEEGLSNDESCSKEMKLLENFIQNKSKVRYLDEEDEQLDKKFESRRKSTRLRSKGYRPDFKAMELPDVSDEETNDTHLGDSVLDDSIKDEFTPVDITGTTSMTVEATKINNRGKKRKRKHLEPEEDPDFELSDENPDFGVSDTEPDLKSTDADPDFQLKLNIEDDELFEPQDETMRKIVVSSNNPGARKVPKVPMKKIVIETCVGITADEMKMKLKSELKWKVIKLEDHADKYTVGKVPSVSQKDRNLDVFEELFSCLVCKGFKAEDKTVFEGHIEEHVNGILRCRFCDYESNNQIGVKKHRKDAHPDLTKRSVIMGYSCELCGVEFRELKQYKNHMAKVHNEARWYCNQCETVYLQESVLIKHKCEVHPDVMAYCKKCKLRFLEMTKKCYDQHVENCPGSSEENEKKGWLCPDCGKLKCTRSDLTQHIKHVHRNIRDYQCPKCSYTAKSSKTLKNHIRTHDGIKPYKCDQCSMSFTQPYQLTSHLRTHTGAKPFKCDQCSYAAAWNVQLKEHRKFHGSPTAVTCEACNVLFKNPKVLNAHTKKEHSS